MKISSGTARGHPLKSPVGQDTRPTSDKVRAALFDSLQFDRPAADARVLDLFAGSGALGLEALSRGASNVVFVEQAPKALTILQENVRRIGQACAGTVRVQRGDALKVASKLRQTAASFDLILVDPPYAAWPDLWPRLAPHLAPASGADGGLLAAGGVLVLESTKGAIPEWTSAEQWQPRRTKHYGDTALSFWYGDDYTARSSATNSENERP